ncbi:glycosyltransferase [Salirhabdus salicampi]|uniref:glycosyltransferase n=1 Tax=Salirhabdus salicampi TaxID=476102 RepID=UPI0020C53CDD|nr:glycosyltransferase [Salirhabdus salicampi]MCP8617524.1 glycosyltransferase [Salirhabdus salicampi]
MIKVLFFIHDLSGGGAEKVLVNLVNNMDKTRFKITLLTMFNKGVNKQYLNKDVEYKYIFNWSFRGNQHLLKLFPPDFLYRKMVPGNYDIVISYMQGATTRIVSGNKNNKIKKINWIHNEMSKKKLVHSYRNYKEFVECYQSFDATVFVAKSAKDIFEANTNLNNNNIVKYNTIEADQIIAKSYEKIDNVQLNKNQLNLITIGSLTHQKGYDRLLRIICKLVKDNLRFHLYILGEGPLRKQLVDYINKQNLSNYVTLLGYKNNPYKFLRFADLFVCSSYHEGYSTVVTESLIVGTPVITTLCSGMEEMLGCNNEYGLIVNNNEDDLYKGLLRMIKDDNLRNHYKEKAIERSKYFNTDNTVKSVEDLFIDLLKDKKE